MDNKNSSSTINQVGYSEALATWSVRYIDPSGFECILSLQGETGAEVLKKSEGAISYLTETNCLPICISL